MTVLAPAAPLRTPELAIPDLGIPDLGMPGMTWERLQARGRLRARLAVLGPAFVAAVAYVDPGNFATNIEGGSRFGYRLLWVVVAANALAMLIQWLSAKLGVVTGRNLAELCREHYPRRVVLGLWLQAEVMAMATDLAEFVGAALGLHLVLGLPLLPAGLVTAVVAVGVLSLQTRGHRPFEVTIAALLAVVLAGFTYQALLAGPSAGGMLGGLVPGFAGPDSAVLAVGILGATVMPHAIYLHSALTAGRIRCQSEADTRALLRGERSEIVVALGLAGLVNIAMLAVAARLFHGPGGAVVHTLEGAHAGLGAALGPAAALAFGLALVAAGLSSSSVGTYAGQVVLAGFVRRSIPLLARRVLTLAPALAVLALAGSPTAALVWSQTVLSFGIPFALVPLLLLTRRADVMGPHVNSRLTSAAALGAAAVVIALNGYLLVATL